MSSKSNKPEPAEDAPCILVVDDEPMMRQMLATLLKRAGYRSVTASGPAKALAMIKEHDIDLVITDVNMPDGSGLERVPVIHELEPDLPIIVVTGFPNVDDAVGLIRDGVTDYLQKPLDLKQVESVVRASLASRQIAENEPDDDSNLELSEVLGEEIKEVGDYRIIKEIGHGTMGIVYLVEKKNNSDGTQYAMKVLMPNAEEREREIIRERFHREAEAASAINHPNIVKIVQFGVALKARVPYMVMEFVDGTSLAQMIASDTWMSYQDKVKIIRQIADCLDSIHRNDMLHRDIKPTNIIITKDNKVKLTDFGLVRLPGSDLTGVHNVVGTPSYLAPEAYRDATADERVDLFALGVMMYEFLLGERPFNAVVFASLQLQIMNNDPQEPRKRDPGFPIPLQMIIAKLISKKPDDRYQTAADLITDLDRFLADDYGAMDKVKHFMAKGKGWS